MRGPDGRAGVQSEAAAVNGRVHGGPDARGPARIDFSTTINGLGACPAALATVCAADVTRYPDPSYTALRRRLAARHGVEPRRILLAGSGSEFIQRLTAVGARLAPGPVALPRHAFGDYAAAARAWGRPLVPLDDPAATLRWLADPASPVGDATPPPTGLEHLPTVLDLAGDPLRADPAEGWPADARERAFCLHSPNKALGLPGVRGAYAIAPAHAAWPVDDWCAALTAAEPSWVLSAQAVAMLDAWCDEGVGRWVEASRLTLGGWTRALVERLQALGFTRRPGSAHYVCVRPPPALAPAAAALRARGIALRETTSFGLPGEWRLGAQPPAAVDALIAALEATLPARATRQAVGP